MKERTAYTFAVPAEEIDRLARRRRSSSLGGLRRWLESKHWGEAFELGRFAGSDWTLLVVVLALSCLGILMIYSASLPGHFVPLNAPLNYYAVRQLRWLAIGLAAMGLFWAVRYSFWKEWGVELLAGSIGVLILVLVFGHERFNATRTFFQGSIQPSEFVKLAMVLYAAIWLSSKKEKLQSFSFGLMPYGLVFGIVGGLIFLQPDKSTALLLLAVAVVMFIVAGAHWKEVAVIVVVIVLVVASIVVPAGYARDRAVRFLALWGQQPVVDPNDQAYWFIQSLRAGGLFGKGFAAGEVKAYVILPHSDGIFAVIGEEFGLLGVLVLLGLYVWLARKGLEIARHAPDMLGMLMALGITVWLTLQAFINIAVVAGAAPVTGMPLPFLSYGGSSLVSSLAGVGVLLNISRYAGGEEGPEHAGSAVWGRDRRTRLSHPGRR